MFWFFKAAAGHWDEVLSASEGSWPRLAGYSYAVYVGRRSREMKITLTMPQASSA